MKSTKEKLEQAVIKPFLDEGYKQFTGEHIQEEMSDGFLRDDLKQYHLIRNENQYDRFFRYIKKTLAIGNQIH